MEKAFAQGPFYGKLVTTINKIKQFNKMVYSKSEGGSKRKHMLPGMPNPALRAKLDAKDGRSPNPRSSKLSDGRNGGLSANSRHSQTHAGTNKPCDLNSDKKITNRNANEKLLATVKKMDA